MKKITTLFAIAMLASSAIAGPVTYSSKSSKVVNTPMAPESCFGPGFDIGLYGAGLFPRDTRDGYDNGGGGGFLLEYFFCNWVGVQASYTINSTASGLHTYSGDLVLRLPIESICVAPYVIAGGGGDTDGESLGQWHVGGGLDVRFRGSPLGLFADGQYFWHDNDNRDYTMVRAGLKWKL